MSRTNDELQGITRLGDQNTAYSYDYNPQVLETFSNKHPENEYLVTFNCPEFTTLCPKTGQPDFGHIIIRYVPDKRCIEEALKNYDDYCKQFKDKTAAAEEEIPF